MASIFRLLGAARLCSTLRIYSGFIPNNADTEPPERCSSLVLLLVFLPDVLLYMLVRLKAGKQSRPFAYKFFLFFFPQSLEKRGKLHAGV